MKQYAPHCDRNQDAILAVLRHELTDTGTVLELGSGNGQHAAYFARHLSHLRWQPSDLLENHASIQAWRREARLANLAQPVELDVGRLPWPVDSVDAIFTANTFHIMAWPLVECVFRGAARVLNPGGLLCVYGPFRYSGRFTSQGNRDFDGRLRGDDPTRGIRDFEQVDACARGAGMRLTADHDMPANNRILVWKIESSCD